MPLQLAIQVDETSQVGEVRRAASHMAERAGLPETVCGKVSIIATEMANNLVLHASQGEILMQVLRTGTGSSMDLVSIDKGPGMADVERCLRDGYSTGGTSGTGLGAIKRLSSEFDIHSIAPLGTVVFSRVHGQMTTIAPPGRFQFGAVSLPFPGETVCGDNWTCSEDEGAFRLMVADGLGHGPLAAAAADAAAGSFEASPNADPRTMLESAHRNLSGTRGAAVAVACLDCERGELKYAGVGNIAGILSTAAGNQGLVSHNGIVGSQRPKIHQFVYECHGAGLLIMNSDGLKTRWSVTDHPGLSTRHPAVIAAVLYRDFRRERDDTTVVVVRFSATRV